MGKAVKVKVSFTDDAGNSETLTSAATAAVAAKPPDVTSVKITSDAGDDDTYRNGDVITVSVTFDEAVDVDTSEGTPRLKIDMDPAEWGEKWAELRQRQRHENPDLHPHGGGTQHLPAGHRRAGRTPWS